ncbi:MAG: hypothetical protein QM802_20615 [Agriterribacter sp.]
MNNKKVTSIISNIQKNAFRSKRTCLFEGCTEESIMSHLLQKNGIVNQISEDRHVYENGLNPFAEHKFDFKLKGINEALTHKAFCNRHDTELFYAIEQPCEQFDSYQSHLLLSLRPVMIERRKREIGSDFFNRVLNAEVLQPIEEAYRKRLEAMIAGDIKGMADGKKIEAKLFENISDLKINEYEFLQLIVPKLEICCCSNFTYETSAEIRNQTWNKLPVNLQNIFFHIIPLGSETKIIVGALKSNTTDCWNYVNKFSTMSIKELQIRISDILINQVENWACSPSFYRSNFLPRLKLINQLIRNRMHNDNERATNGLNLFEI